MILPSSLNREHRYDALPFRASRRVEIWARGANWPRNPQNHEISGWGNVAVASRMGSSFYSRYLCPIKAWFPGRTGTCGATQHTHNFGVDMNKITPLAAGRSWCQPSFSLSLAPNPVTIMWHV